MKKDILLIGIILLCVQAVFTQPDLHSSHKKIEKDTDKIYENLVKIRRDLHQFPETAKNEKRTSKIIQKYLLELGLEVKTDIGGYGVVGILKGNKKGRKIAWRADMDAIRFQANDRFSFKSQNKGIAHMCGHDVHTAIGLGIANVLVKQKESLQGTIYFIFQPAEETFTGAKAMLEDGLLELIKPDEIYGLHITPFETGVITTKPNELFAYQKTVVLKFKPNANADELKSSVKKIFRELSRNKKNSKPWELQKMTNREVGLLSPNTAYKDYLFFEPNVRVTRDENSTILKVGLYETNRKRLKSIPQKIKAKINRTRHRESLISVNYAQGRPTVINDRKLTEKALGTLKKIYSDKSIKKLHGQTPYFNEDFIYFQKKIPGVLFFFGGSNVKKNLFAMPHSPDFAVDEEAIRLGVKQFSSLVMERAKSN